MITSLKEQYADYISRHIESGEGKLLSFDDWQDDRKREDRKMHSIARWSEKLQALITFRVEADTMADATKAAQHALEAFERKHDVEIGDNGKVLTPAEIRQKLIAKAERFLAAEQRKLERMRKKAEKLAMELKIERQ